jgi:hypothetical protein
VILKASMIRDCRLQPRAFWPSQREVPQGLEAVMQLALFMQAWKACSTQLIQA